MAESNHFCEKNNYRRRHCGNKGIGGFHLCCDASNEVSVSHLRELKRRPMKPFAVMAKNLESVKKECEVSEEQAENSGRTPKTNPSSG